MIFFSEKSIPTQVSVTQNLIFCFITAIFTQVEKENKLCHVSWFWCKFFWFVDWHQWLQKTKEVVKKIFLCCFQIRPTGFRYEVCIEYSLDNLKFFNLLFKNCKNYRDSKRDLKQLHSNWLNNFWINHFRIKDWFKKLEISDPNLPFRLQIW